MSEICYTESRPCKHINILLSRHFDRLSRIIYHVTGRGYTHASIGLEEEEDTFYSFNGRGFRTESPRKWKSKDNRIVSMVYRLEVDEITYEKVKEYIEYIKNNKDRYKYSKFGAFMCILRIPYHEKDKFFCSQFVAHVLKETEILDIPTPAYMILPNSFCDLLKIKKFTKITYC